VATPEEPDFPVGHPKRYGYDPASPEAKEWARLHIHPAGERDFPVGHAKAIDTPGNQNHIPAEPGVDPLHPELEPFTGHTPDQVAAERALWNERVKAAGPSPEREPILAPPPPEKPGDTRPPTGQPDRGLLEYLRSRGLLGE
jgi:hypothetical protein